MRVCDLRQKEVINICTCRCIGHVIDVEFDECSGCIRALIIPGDCKLFGMFGKDSEVIIPWCNIVKMGPDIILVELKEVDKK